MHKKSGHGLLCTMEEEHGETRLLLQYGRWECVVQATVVHGYNIDQSLHFYANFEYNALSWILHPLIINRNILEIHRMFLMALCCSSI